jgi:hypothetical protein
MAVADTVVPMPNRENSSTPWYRRKRLWGRAPRSKAQFGKKGITATLSSMPPQM